MKILSDNSSVICLSKNLMHHSREKNIDIKHNFIRSHILKGDTDISLFSTKFHLASIFTKLFLEDKFCFLRKSLGIFQNLF